MTLRLGQEFGWSHLDLAGDEGRKGNRLQFPVRAMGNTNDGDPAACHFNGWLMVEFAKTEPVGEGARSLLGDKQADLHLVLESQRVQVMTFGMDARQPEWRVKLGHHDRMAQGPKKGMFGSFHVTKEIRVMNNAGHVGIGELHTSNGCELTGHELPVGTDRLRVRLCHNERFEGSNQFLGHAPSAEFAMDRCASGVAECRGAIGIDQQ
jgi:hypothetical protein